MIISIEIPDDVVGDLPTGVAALVIGAYVDGVARQVKDKLTHGQVAITGNFLADRTLATERALAEWEIIDCDECEVAQ